MNTSREGQLNKQEVMRQIPKVRVGRPGEM